MGSRIEARLHAPAALLAAALAVGGCAVTQPDAGSYNPPPVGATWTVAQKNTGSYGQDAQLRFTRGETTWQGKPALAFASSRGFTTVALPDSGKWLAVLGPDGKPVLSWDPPLGWEFPLVLGKTWTTSYRMTMHATGRTLPYDMSCAVESYGDTTVPAGTFKTYKIRCTTTIGTEEIYWTSPGLGTFVKTSLRRNANSPFGPGTQDSELVAQDIRK